MPAAVCVLTLGPAPEPVGEARRAAAVHLVQRLRGVDPQAEIFVLTPDEQPSFPPSVRVVPTPVRGFHWGREMASLVAKLSPERLLYFSGGSGFLLREEELRFLLSYRAEGHIALLSNLYSTDFALITDPSPEIFWDLERDNALGLRLHAAGYSCLELPRSWHTQLDIDTPGELQVLKLLPELPPGIRRVLEGIPEERARRVLEVIATPGKVLTLVGRVSGHLLHELEREAACRVRALSEGRGMKAEDLSPPSLLGELFRARGPKGTVEALAGGSDALVWDIRVLWKALGIWPSPEERFAFDLLELEALQEPLLLELGEAIATAGIPILVGGHSLVSGAMYLAVELAWRGKEIRRKLGYLEACHEGASA